MNSWVDCSCVILAVIGGAEHYHCRCLINRAITVFARKRGVNNDKNSECWQISENHLKVIKLQPVVVLSALELSAMDLGITAGPHT